MSISLRMEYSHSKSYEKDVMTVFKVILVPEKVAKISGLHYILLIDASNSMRRGKLDLAKDGAMNLVEKIPRENKVSLITFGDTAKILVEAMEPTYALEAIPTIKTQGNTAMFTALMKAIDLANKYRIPGKIIVLTDGMPTDVNITDSYSRIPIPSGFSVYAIGIGNNYREEILKALADNTNGIFYHLENAEDLPNVMKSTVSEEFAARNVQVDFEAPSKVHVLNYSGPPVVLGEMEGTVKILGSVAMRAMFTGTLLKVNVKYEDEAGIPRTISDTLNVTQAASKEDYISGINPDIISEYKYYEVLKSYEDSVSSGNLVEATRRMDRLMTVAEQTRKIDVIEETRRLSTNLESTMRLGNNEEATRKLARETLSEVTKRMRKNE